MKKTIRKGLAAIALSGILIGCGKSGKSYETFNDVPATEGYDVNLVETRVGSEITKIFMRVYDEKNPSKGYLNMDEYAGGSFTTELRPSGGRELSKLGSYESFKKIYDSIRKK